MLRDILQATATPVCETAVNAFGFTQYDGQCSFFEARNPLPEAVGWAVIIGFALAFSLMTTALVWVDYNFGGTVMTSEEFNTAGRSVKTGLTGSVIVSQWTWAATLLQSSNVAWKYGVSGPLWYAAGATIQVLLFAILALHVKLKASKAHTVLEIVKARWGTTAHLVFMFFAFATNILVSSMLILGGAAVTTALTGVNIYAASMLIPVGVILYTASGGLKATFMASYIHTAILYIALVIFTFKVYASDELMIGSPGKVWDNLQIISEKYPVLDNKGGSLLTMLSKSGFIFGIINIVGNFGTVFLDQSYWQSAIAAKPSATYKGYILGGLCWFAIPFTLATSLGLAARALDLPLSATEAGDGLVPPAVAYHIMGNGGAVLILIMLFMAVTSTGSAEQIAVSSLFAYDVYRTYINPQATGKDIIRVSQYAIVGYGIFMGVLSIILLEIGLNLGWVYLFMGIIIGSAVFPVYSCLTWDKTSAFAAIAGSVSGLVGALIAWLVTCAAYYGPITVDNLGGDYPMLAGNVTALGLSLIVTSVLSYARPQNFDWPEMNANIHMIEEDGSDKPGVGEDSEEGVRAGLRFTLRWGTLLTVVLVVLWPLLALPAGVFSKGYFYFWTAIAIAWGLVATALMIFMPIIESAKGIAETMGNVLAWRRIDPEERAAKEVETTVHGISLDGSTKPVKDTAAGNGAMV